MFVHSSKSFLSLFVLNLRAMDEGVNGLTTVNGLSSNTVLAVTRDRQGFVYFGTTIGLIVLTGRGLLIYLLPKIFHRTCVL